MSFPKFVTLTQNIPFFSPILPVFALLNDIRVYIACMVLKNNPNYVIFFFYEDDIQLNFKYKWPPGGGGDKKHFIFTCLFIYLFIHLIN